LLRNPFADAVAEAEAQGAGVEVLTELLGRGRAKLGMFEGDLERGELEIGQVSAMLREIRPAREILNDIWSQFQSEKEKLTRL